MFGDSIPFPLRLRSRVFLGAATLILVFILVIYFSAIPLIESSMQAAEERAGLTIIDNVRQLVDMGNEELVQYRLAALEERKIKLRDIVGMAEKSLRFHYAEARADGMGKPAALKHALKIIREFRYGKDDYVWIFNDDARLIAHPDKKIDGADFSRALDMKGALIIPHMVEIGIEHGEGFFSYWWNRLGQKEPSQKLAYTRHLADLDVHIATGLYIDDIEELVTQRKSQLMDNLARRIGEIRVAREGYVYVFDSDYNMHFHPNIAGKNLRQTQNPVTGNLILDELMAVAGKPEGLRYLWDKPGDEKHYVHQKISWVRHMPDIDWYVASSVYLDDLYESADALSQRLMLLGLIGLLAALMLAYLFARRISRPIVELAGVAHRVQAGDLDARSEIRSRDEVGELADAFNRMVAQLRDHIQNLDRRIDERTREITTANAELEDRVALRTRELAESNQQLSKAVDTLRQAQDELVRSERLASLGALVAGIAHELNTPLGNGLTVVSAFEVDIKNFSRDMEEGRLKKSSLKDYVERSRQATDLLMRNLTRAAELISNFKQVAVDQTSAHRRPFDLGEIVRENLETLWPQFKRTPHRFEQSVPAGILMDSYPGPLGQVLTNLVINALIHGFDECQNLEGKVQVVAEVPGNGFVCIKVVDNGRGIPPENLPKVFDPFFTTRLGKGGSGLGLHIVYGLVTRTLGGRIEVMSQPGQGTTFSLKLPLVAPDPDAPCVATELA